MDKRICKRCVEKTGKPMETCPSRLAFKCHFMPHGYTQLTAVEGLERENEKLRSEFGRVGADLRVVDAAHNESQAKIIVSDERWLKYLEIALDSQAAAIKAKDAQIDLLEGKLFRLLVGKEVFEGISEYEVTKED